MHPPMPAPHQPSSQLLPPMPHPAEAESEAHMPAISGTKNQCSWPDQTCLGFTDHVNTQAWILSGIMCVVPCSRPVGACHSRPGFAACCGKERASNASAPAWPMRVCVPASRTPPAGSAPCTLCPGRTHSSCTKTAWHFALNETLYYLQGATTHWLSGDMHTTPTILLVSEALDILHISNTDTGATTIR